MNRPIKFRAWDGKRIIYDINLGDFQELNHIFEGHRSIKAFMQFTGLSDKNGKEIYEGDVVNTFEYDGISEEPVRVFLKNTVAWFQRYAGYGIATLPEQAQMDGWRNEYEVIGNIYENPELLKN